MSPNAAKTPNDLAITTGTPILGRFSRSGLYASDVQGDANALCHVSDLLERKDQNHCLLSSCLDICKYLEFNLTKIQINYLLYTVVRTTPDYSYTATEAAYSSK